MMFPLVVNTSPQNGSLDVELNEIIRIEFSSDIFEGSVNSENIVVRNETANLYMRDADIQLINGNCIEITVPLIGTTLHRYEGLNEYRVIISHIISTDGEELEATYTLRFTTRSSSITENLPTPTPINDSFNVIRTYPKKNSITTPELIKIQCSRVIDPLSQLIGIILTDIEDVDDIEGVLFAGQNLVEENTITINGNVIEIIPPVDTSGGKRYSVIVSDIVDTSGNKITPYIFSFYTSFVPMYSTIRDVSIDPSVSKLIIGMENLTIASKIHENSRLAEFIANEAENTEVDFDTPALYVSEYVKSKTQYDIIFDKFIEISSNASSKQLKDLSIEYGFSINDMLRMADALRLKYKYWEDIIKGQRNRGNARAGVFIKGEAVDILPDFMNRQLKDFEGGKSW